MDNQQERLFHIGYLLAMLDGEGSTQFQCKVKTKSGNYYRPKISIFNNNPHIIQQTINALKFLEIPFHVWTPTKKALEKRVVYRIEIVGLKRCKRFAEVVSNYPFGKKERIGVIKDYIDLRESIETTQRQSGHYKSYGEKEYSLVEKLKELNAEYRGTESSETIRFET